MPQPALTVDDLIAWNERTHAEWRKLLTAHPEVLSFSCDIAGAKTVAELLQHIVAPERRYAQQLAGESMTDYKDIPFDSVESVYATHDRAIARFRQLLADSTINWDEPFEFMTRTLGPARSTRKTVLFHALLHCIRHYAQLTTLVRQHGITHKLPQDYLVMHFERVEPTSAS
ncbi:DinB family protein [Edaphobacter sp.]|uniref:DinB family protein n=1 Tax=Edaphobacter sp. TaxID=1934404 RepID=UPI002DBE3984|nr:DinB family protein [Edaphobacter sp.]HEU5340036.1 DinB family protein [Edaphobacter sp.]